MFFKGGTLILLALLSQGEARTLLLTPYRGHHLHTLVLVLGTRVPSLPLKHARQGCQELLQSREAARRRGALPAVNSVGVLTLVYHDCKSCLKIHSSINRDAQNIEVDFGQHKIDFATH